jgi:hypothetical protein
VFGWLLTRRTLPSQEIFLDAIPRPNLLPAVSDIQRGTYALVEEYIR